MTSTLSFSKSVPLYQGGATSAKLDNTPIAATGIAHARLKEDESSVDKRYWLLGGVVILLHVAAVLGYINRDTSSHYVPEKREVFIEFIKPEVIPPPPVEPPPPPPPQPKVQKVTPPPPPQPVLRTQAASEVIKANDIVVQENTEAPKSTGPVVAAAVPTPAVTASAPAAPSAAPVAEEPVTEATANAAYLNNPAPDYPAAASRNGWGGTVVLRVRVSASGSALDVTVKKSSGRKVLDESAIAAVKNWTFVPSKRGSKPIDGWATVPIIFNPEQ